MTATNINHTTSSEHPYRGDQPEDVILRVENLSTHFNLRMGLLKAVDDISFTLRRGETLCIVGESGSGKSVTARSILQIVQPPGKVVAGKVLLHGVGGDRSRVIDMISLDPRGSEVRKIRGKEISMIFQEPMSSLSPVHKIGFQIDEALRLHTNLDKKGRRDRTIELLTRVEIPDPQMTIDRYPFEYSGGMRQRAVIAMALSCNPSILIADEPTTALDVTTQAEILDLIKEIQKNTGMAVIFITHDIGVVAEIADSVCVMRHGKIVESGSVFDIFKKPEHPYSRMLIGSAIKLETPSDAKTRMRQSRPVGKEAPLLKIENLTKSFTVNKGFFRRATSTVKAVDSVSLDLRNGENLGIVGESGSGKTTLVHSILRMIAPNEGSVIYQGADSGIVDISKLGRTDLRKVYREIRMIFQDPYGSLNPRMTVEQIVGEPLLMMGWKPKKIRERVVELLEKVDLSAECRERYPHAFSGGQRQRISIARALAPNPRIIIADEATSALDVSLRAQVLDLLLSLQEKMGLSFIFISHDISVIRYFCDRVAVMYQGKVVEVGDVLQVCDHPKHAYTKALLSAVPRPDPLRRRIQERHRYIANE